MSRRDFTERDIHMALDGELPREERAEYDAWLDANHEMKARSVRFEADRTRLREAFADVFDERVPDRLTKLVTGEARRSGAGAPRWRMAAAAAVLLALALVAAIWPASADLACRRRQRTNSPKKRLPPTRSMQLNGVTRSRWAPTTRTIFSAGCPTGLG